MSIAIDHAGKVALVTGSGAGIGREIARWLARAGAAVAVNDARAEKAADTVSLIEAEGGRAIAVVADCRDDAQVAEMVQRTVHVLGGLDIAVNNIGMLAGRGASAFVDTDGGYWRDVVGQNLILTAVCAQHQARAMIDGGHGGVMLLVTSGETTRPSPFNSAYAASKAALNHLVTSLAMELGEHGIRVLAIAPGTTLTDTVRAAFTDEHVNAIDQSTALKRRVEHDELGRLAVFLASDLARCITGQFILADAGAFLSRTRPPNLRHEETRLGDRPDHTSQPARPGPDRPPAERNDSRGAS
jgi:NAD(P)-dependent dehydrogenase (short-subunit alcohol dehydrogenase family)